MDPLTAAGAVATVFTLLGYCVQGFVLLTDAQNIGSVSNTLLCQLSVQELRLVQWAERAGLLSDDGRLHRRLESCAPVIKQVLGNLSELLSDRDKLCRRYNFQLSADPPSSFSANATIATSGSSILDSEYLKNARRDVLFRAKLIKSKNVWPKRLWWAAVDAAKFKEMVTTVKGFVQDLWDLSTPLDTSAMTATMESVLAQVIALNDRIPDLQTLQKTLVREDDPDRGDQMLASAAYLKATKLQLEQADNLPPGSNTQGMGSYVSQVEELSWKDIKGFTCFDGNSDRGMAKYRGGHVFVEYARIFPVQYRNSVIRRAKNIAKFLNAPKHPVFRSLNCRGIAIGRRPDMEPGREWIAFVHYLPSNSRLSVVSLRSLLSQDGILPSVNARMDLAWRILQSIRFTHTAGWIHRSLRSENVVFFIPNGVTPIPKGGGSLPRPTLVGFSSARLVEARLSQGFGADSPAKDIYEHPDHLHSKRFEPYMDIYAIGTIMVELADWRPLSRLVRSVIDVNEEDEDWTIDKVCPFLRKTAEHGGVFNLSFRMGDIFANVTKLCLSADSSINSDTSDDDRREVQSALALESKALQNLERCKV